MRARVLAAAALLLATNVFAQELASDAWPKATVRIFPLVDQETAGTLTLVDRDDKLAIDLNLDHLPPGQPFALHAFDKGRCFAGAAATPSPDDAVLLALPEMRADASGHAKLSFVLEKSALAAGPAAFARFPLGVYATAEHGGGALACGNASLAWNPAQVQLADVTAPTFVRPEAGALVLLLVEKTGLPLLAPGDQMLLPQLQSQLAADGFKTAVLDVADYRLLVIDALATVPHDQGDARALSLARQRALAKLARIAADTSHCALVIRAGLVFRTAKLDNINAEWDGQRRALQLQEASEVSTAAGNRRIQTLRFTGTTQALSVELTAYDANGALAFVKRGGVLVPSLMNVGQQKARWRDDLFKTDAEIADGVKIALSPLQSR